MSNHYKSLEATILMPCSNVDYLQETLKSINAQDIGWEKFEVIIVADEISTKTIYDLIAKSENNITVLQSPGDGIVDALNHGLDFAKSDLIFRMDADDIMAPNRLSTQIDFMKNNLEYVLCGSQVRFIDSNGKKIGRSYYPSVDRSIKKTLNYMSPLAHPSVCVRRENLISIKKYRKIDPEDWDLWIRLKDQGKFINLPLMLIDYRIHKSQSSRKLKINHWFILSRMKILKLYNLKKIDDLVIINTNNLKTLRETLKQETLLSKYTKYKYLIALKFINDKNIFYFIILFIRVTKNKLEYTLLKKFYT